MKEENNEGRRKINEEDKCMRKKDTFGKQKK